MTANQTCTYENNRSRRLTRTNNSTSHAVHIKHSSTTTTLQTRPNIPVTPCDQKTFFLMFISMCLGDQTPSYESFNDHCSPETSLFYQILNLLFNYEPLRPFSRLAWHGGFPLSRMAFRVGKLCWWRRPYNLYFLIQGQEFFLSWGKFHPQHQRTSFSALLFRQVLEIPAPLRARKQWVISLFATLLCICERYQRRQRRRCGSGIATNLIFSDRLNFLVERAKPLLRCNGMRNTVTRASNEYEWLLFLLNHDVTMEHEHWTDCEVFRSAVIGANIFSFVFALLLVALFLYYLL